MVYFCMVFLVGRYLLTNEEHRPFLKSKVILRKYHKILFPHPSVPVQKLT